MVGRQTHNHDRESQRRSTTEDTNIHTHTLTGVRDDCVSNQGLPYPSCRVAVGGCICSHLDNYLVDTQSGEIVPIDFGMAFGMGTALLPVRRRELEGWGLGAP